MPNKEALNELETNKAAALELASSVINGTDYPRDIPRGYNLTTVIENLSEEKDLQNNIFWNVQGDQLVRDGGEAQNPPIETKESYVIQYLNNVRGAISLVEDVNLRKNLEKEALEKVTSLMKTQDIKSLTQQVIALNTSLTIELIDNGITDAQSKINKAKNYAGLKDKHYHITTLSAAVNDAGENVTVIESEIKTSRLTQVQKDMFADLSNQNWYKKMPKWEQNLVKENFNELTSGNKVIPTQLRSSIPLLRNAYRKILAIKQEGKETEVILETSHSGAVSSHTKGNNNVDLTAQNIEQLQQYAPDGEIHLNSLLSPINMGDEDAHDASTTKAAMKKTSKVVNSTTPYNFFRTWANGGGRDLSGSKGILKNLGKELESQKGYKTIAFYLKNGKEPTSPHPTTKIMSLEKQLQQIKDPKLKQFLQNAVDTRRDIDSLPMFYNHANIFSNKIDKENSHARIAANMKIISYNAKPVLTTAFPKMTLKNTPIMHSFCKSGKDRTQMVEIETSQRALNQAIGTTNSAENLKAVLSARSAANLAGTQGGSPGCDSIRASTATSGNKDIFGKVVSYFADKRAGFNKFTVNATAINLAIIKKNIGRLLNASNTMSKISTIVSSSTKASSQKRQR